MQRIRDAWERALVDTSTGPGPEDDKPVLPSRSTDDTDTGWGEPSSTDEDPDDERLTRERPPHWE